MNLFIIQVFDKSGNHRFNFGVAGKEEGQLWYPRKVAVVRSTGKFVVCDRGNERSRMQIFTKNGHFLKKIAVSLILNNIIINIIILISISKKVKKNK